MRRFFWLYQALMAALALAVVWLVTQPEDVPWVRFANLTVWFLFSADYLIRLALARDRWRFVRRNIPDLIASLPVDLIAPGDDAFELLRLFRLARFVRLVRAGAVLWRVSANVRGVLEANGLGYVLLFLGTVIVLGGIAIAAIEPEIDSLPDGIWWSLVTATTVGYGDIAPKTPLGRLVAAVLMVLGISTFGMVTSAMTTFFLRRQRSADPHVTHVIAQLERWDDLSPAERRRLAAILGTLADEEGGMVTGSSSG